MGNADRAPQSQPPHDPDGGGGEELTVLLAEYQMLTTRNTQWLALQNGIWPILLAVIALLLQLVPGVQLSTVLWLAFIALELAVLGYSLVGSESYNNVVFMETKLRPRVRELVGGRNVLRYESWVQDHRPAAQAIYDYGPPAFVSVVLLLALYRYDTPAALRWLWQLALWLLIVLNWVAAWRAAEAREKIPIAD